MICISPPPPEIILNQDRIPEFPPSVDSILANSLEAAITFQVADSVVELEESSTVQLSLGVVRQMDSLKNVIHGFSPVADDRVRVSDLMQAKLVSSGFAVTPITPENQLISNDATTEWRWNIAATKPGRHRLELALNAIVLWRGAERTRCVGSRNRLVLVQVTLGKWLGLFISGNWQWLSTALVIPFIAWVWSRMRLNDANPQRPSSQRKGTKKRSPKL